MAKLTKRAIVESDITTFLGLIAAGCPEREAAKMIGLSLKALLKSLTDNVVLAQFLVRARTTRRITLTKLISETMTVQVRAGHSWWTAAALHTHELPVKDPAHVEVRQKEVMKRIDMVFGRIMQFIPEDRRSEVMAELEREVGRSQSKKIGG